MSNIEYNERKRQSNLKKHGKDFKDAPKVFKDPKHVTKRSDQNGEERFNSVGKVLSDFWSVIWCKRDPNKRIISLRDASKKERDWYNS